jgi:hypothetical protein
VNDLITAYLYRPTTFSVLCLKEKTLYQNRASKVTVEILRKIRGHEIEQFGSSFYCLVHFKRNGSVNMFKHAVTNIKTQQISFMYKNPFVHFYSLRIKNKIVVTTLEARCA